MSLCQHGRRQPVSITSVTLCTPLWKPTAFADVMALVASELPIDTSAAFQEAKAAAKLIAKGVLDIYGYCYFWQLSVKHSFPKHSVSCLPSSSCEQQLLLHYGYWLSFIYPWLSQEQWRSFLCSVRNWAHLPHSPSLLQVIQFRTEPHWLNIKMENQSKPIYGLSNESLKYI